LLEHLNGNAKAPAFRFADQEVDVLGHHHVAAEVKAIPAAHFLQSLFEEIRAAALARRGARR